MTDDEKLLKRFTGTRAEEAFGTIVSKHINLVYSVAIRIVGGDAHLAKDVVQTVFIDLSIKAARLPRKVVLAGWLCRHTFFVASSRIRAEQRRRERERKAAEMNTFTPEFEPDWQQLTAVLDEALQSLSRRDRDAIVLRYFEGHDLKYVGAALGLSEDAAQKRVSRALQKLRRAFSARGLALTAAGLGSALTAHAITAAPVGMAAGVTASTFAGMGTASTAATGWLKVLFALKPKLVLMSVFAVVAVTISATWVLHLDRARAATIPVKPSQETAAMMARVPREPRTSAGQASRLHWSQIESSDYAKYIANLRAIGCPEATIRDIIVADLNQIYGKRAQAIWPRRENAYWKKQRQTAPTREQLMALKEVQKEASDVIKYLLGIRIDPQETVDLVFAQLPQPGRSLWFLSEEKRQAANQQLREAGFEERRAANSASDGREFFDDELQALADVLTPQELDLFRLHYSPRAQWLRADIAYFDCTPEEFKALLDLREKSIGPGASDNLSVSRQTDLELARTLFGEDRSQDYERLTDFGYLNGRRAAERAGLPDDLADQVGQIVYEARIAVERLANDAFFPAEALRQQAETIKLTTEEELLKVLGNSPRLAVLSAMRRTLDDTAATIHP